MLSNTQDFLFFTGAVALSCFVSQALVLSIGILQTIVFKNKTKVFMLTELNLKFIYVAVLLR